MYFRENQISSKCFLIMRFFLEDFFHCPITKNPQIYNCEDACMIGRIKISKNEKTHRSKKEIIWFSFSILGVWGEYLNPGGYDSDGKLVSTLPKMSRIDNSRSRLISKATLRHIFFNDPDLPIKRCWDWPDTFELWRVQSRPRSWRVLPPSDILAFILFWSISVLLFHMNLDGWHWRRDYISWNQ